MPKSSHPAPSRIERADIQQLSKKCALEEQDQDLTDNLEFIMDIEFLIQLCGQEDIPND